MNLKIIHGYWWKLKQTTKLGWAAYFNKEEQMDYELHWDNEVVADNDESIAQVEADIAHDKSILASLSIEEDLF